MGSSALETEVPVPECLLVIAGMSTVLLRISEEVGYIMQSMEHTNTYNCLLESFCFVFQTYKHVIETNIWGCVWNYSH
jgi:hypothetical protein